jgi:hypothetical protein
MVQIDETGREDCRQSLCWELKELRRHEFFRTRGSSKGDCAGSGESKGYVTSLCGVVLPWQGYTHIHLSAVYCAVLCSGIPQHVGVMEVMADPLIFTKRMTD